MISEKWVHDASLFLFLTMLDEAETKSASIKVLGSLKWRELEKPEVEIVRLCSEIALRTRFVADEVDFSGTPEAWSVPAGVDFKIWLDFRRKALPEEIISLVWVRILGIDESTVAQGMEVTPGTVRYRLARAVRKLGLLIVPLDTRFV